MVEYSPPKPGVTDVWPGGWIRPKTLVYLACGDHPCPPPSPTLTGAEWCRDPLLGWRSIRNSLCVRAGASYTCTNTVSGALPTWKYTRNSVSPALWPAARSSLETPARDKKSLPIPALNPPQKPKLLLFILLFIKFVLCPSFSVLRVVHNVS